MNERTTIGGVVYESIGSSTSNLLLKCNGIARIQWGTKLVDLIKNGKIAQSEQKEFLFKIENESEIQDEGIYILTEPESIKILLYKDNQKYNLIETDLYISANNKQDMTVEQKIQALQNLGLYFNTLEEVLNSGIQNGFCYVTEKQTLYLIKDGVASEFKPKTQTVTVENEEGKQETDINGINQTVSIDNTSFVKGMIIMYSTQEQIPEGWALCDGTDNTPDLQQMFIIKPTTVSEIEETTNEEQDTEEITNPLNQYLVVYIIKL